MPRSMMISQMLLLIRVLWPKRGVVAFYVTENHIFKSWTVGRSSKRFRSLANVVNDETIGCEHFGKCPGCSFESNVCNIPVVNSAKLYFSSSSIQKFRNENKTQEPFKVIVPSAVSHWRTQAKLAVAPKSSWGRNGCVFGLYERGSHRVMAIPNCQVHHPSINAAVQILTKASANAGTVAYNEDTGEGDLRYVQLQVERMTQKVCLTLVWNAPSIKESQPGLARLTKELKRLDPELWHSIWCNCNNNMGNVIFARGDDRWHRLYGPEFLREPIPGSSEGKLHFSPKAFRQGNMDGFDAIAQYVARSIPSGSKVCELYAGIGILGLTVLSFHADKSSTDVYGGLKRDSSLKWLRCSDENPENVKLFQYTVNSMAKTAVEFTTKQGKSEKKVTYISCSATKALLDGQALGAEVMIVDPPRKGLCEEVINQLCKAHNPKQPYIEDPLLITQPRHVINWTNDIHTLIYVSCGFDSLARDSDRLLSANAGWKLDSAIGYILFPGSDHVESVVIFKRQGRRQDLTK